DALEASAGNDGAGRRAAEFDELLAAGLDVGVNRCAAIPNELLAEGAFDGGVDRPMPAKSADMRPSWPRSHQTSSLRLAIRLRGHCCRRRAPCRSCSRLPPIRSVTVTSTT